MGDAILQEKTGSFYFFTRPRLHKIFYALSADAFIKVSIYLKDDDLDLLIFTCPCSRFRMEMLVVSAPVDSQNLAESFYIVLVTKLMNGV